jgi:hypothetical protein
MTYKNIANSLIGPWRRDIVFHYHRAIDDTRWLTRGNIDLGEGKCWLKTH